MGNLFFFFVFFLNEHATITVYSEEKYDRYFPLLFIIIIIIIFRIWPSIGLGYV